MPVLLQQFSTNTLLLLLLIVIVLIAVLPTYPYSRSWGYAPSGVVGVIVAILLLLYLTGNLSL